MPRGITEKDVFIACDALVLAGERPTIERVRQKIGRGSPNTVSPMLDAWFKGLGRRLQDPGAFAPPSDVPEPVLQAAQHFWEVAQAGARAEIEQHVAERLSPMQAEVDRAVHAQAVAVAQRDSHANQIRDMRLELVDASDHVQAERIAHAATAVREQAVQAQLDDALVRLTAAQGQLQQVEERARRATEAAHERASGAERRAALEIENERAARGRADKLADALEKRIQTLQANSSQKSEDLIAARTSLEHARDEVQRLRARIEQANRLQESVELALTEAKLSAGRAQADAKATQAAMDRLLPFAGATKAKRAATKRT